jgi:hypothetical protein
MPKDDSAARERVGPEVTSPFDVLTRFGIGWLLELFISLAVQKLFDFFDLAYLYRVVHRDDVERS